MTEIERADPVRAGQREALRTLAEYNVGVWFEGTEEGIVLHVRWMDRRRVCGVERLLSGTRGEIGAIVEEVRAVSPEVGRAVAACLVFGLGDGGEEPG